MDKEYTTSDEEIEIDLENVFINFIVGIKKFGLILIILKFILVLDMHMRILILNHNIAVKLHLQYLLMVMMLQN